MPLGFYPALGGLRSYPQLRKEQLVNRDVQRDVAEDVDGLALLRVNQPQLVDLPGPFRPLGNHRKPWLRNRCRQIYPYVQAIEEIVGLWGG